VCFEGRPLFFRLVVGAGAGAGAGAVVSISLFVPIFLSIPCCF
jgi:hypothetical protein